MSTIGIFFVFCFVILLLAIIQVILRLLGKDKLAKALHYTVLLFGLYFLGQVFLQLIYAAEEMFYR